MAALVARLSLALAGLLAKDQALGKASYRAALLQSFHFANGYDADEANSTIIDTRVLGASAFEDIALTETLTDSFGATIDLSIVKAIMILADTANTNDVLVGGVAAEVFFGSSTDQVRIRPGGMLAFVAPDANGYVISQGLEAIRVSNGGAGTPVSFTIAIVGVGNAPPFVTTNGTRAFVTTNRGRNRVAIGRNG